MATRTPVVSGVTPGTAVKLFPNRNATWMSVFWEELTENDTGAALYLNGRVLDAVLHVVGTGGGATLKFQGSKDGTNWVDLDDHTGTEIAITSSNIADDFGLATLYPFLRPSASGGSSQDLDVYLLIQVAE
jgi:hypothetical protein